MLNPPGSTEGGLKELLRQISKGADARHYSLQAQSRNTHNLCDYLASADTVANRPAYFISHLVSFSRDSMRQSAEPFHPYLNKLYGFCLEGLEACQRGMKSAISDAGQMELRSIEARLHECAGDFLGRQFADTHDPSQAEQWQSHKRTAAEMYAALGSTLPAAYQYAIAANASRKLSTVLKKAANREEAAAKTAAKTIEWYENNIRAAHHFTRSTRYRLAARTKHFAATAAMAYAERFALSWTDKLSWLRRQYRAKRDNADLLNATMSDEAAVAYEHAGNIAHGLYEKTDDSFWAERWIENRLLHIEKLGSKFPVTAAERSQIRMDIANALARTVPHGPSHDRLKKLAQDCSRIAEECRKKAKRRYSRTKHPRNHTKRTSTRIRRMRNRHPREDFDKKAALPQEAG